MANPIAALPNFFVVGAPKAGTTSLYNYLDQHPQIYMSPIKEPNYFASEVRPEKFSEELQQQISHEMCALQEYLRGPMSEHRFGGMVLKWEDYLKLFQNVKGEKAIGEASVCYLWSQTAATNIFSRIPDAKIIMILRDPAERAFSQYRHAVRIGLVRKSFREEIQARLRTKSEKFDVLNPFLEFGLYNEQVKRYLELFPRRSVRIFVFEEYQKRPAEMLANILDFLGVDSSTVPDTSRKHLEAQTPRFIAISYLLRRYGIWQRVKGLSPPGLRTALRAFAFRQRKCLVMDPDDRKYLVEYYHDDLVRLADLLDHDLSAWLH